MENEAKLTLTGAEAVTVTRFLKALRDEGLALQRIEGGEPLGMITPVAVSIKEAAAMLGRSPGMVFNMIREKKLPSFFDGKRRYIPVSAIEEYVARRLAARVPKDRKVPGAAGRAAANGRRKVEGRRKF
jgi:excisionase family DNA binding protein